MSAKPMAKAQTANGPAQPRYIRLPDPGMRCPWSCLSRAQLKRLIYKSAKAPHPPVSSIAIPNRAQNKRGTRLIVLQSLMDYLHHLELEAEGIHRPWFSKGRAVA
jgi:hypothetical protein